jgi:type IV fimbrial biogenesis protein FimT
MPNSDDRTVSKQRGFTLVELLVVMGIIAIIVGMGIPSLVGYAQQLRLSAATRQVVGLILLARGKAIGSRQNHAVVLNPEESTVTVVNLVSGDPLEEIVRIPSKISLELRIGGQSSQEMQFIFRTSGALVGRSVTLVLSDRHRQQTVTVTGATGAVSVE